MSPPAVPQQNALSGLMQGSNPDGGARHVRTAAELHAAVQAVHSPPVVPGGPPVVRPIPPPPQRTPAGNALLGVGAPMAAPARAFVPAPTPAIAGPGAGAPPAPPMLSPGQPGIPAGSLPHGLPGMPPAPTPRPGMPSPMTPEAQMLAHTYQATRQVPQLSAPDLAAYRGHNTAALAGLTDLLSRPGVTYASVMQLLVGLAQRGAIPLDQAFKIASTMPHDPVHLRQVVLQLLKFMAHVGAAMNVEHHRRTPGTTV